MEVISLNKKDLSPDTSRKPSLPGSLGALRLGLLSLPIMAGTHPEPHRGAEDGPGPGRAQRCAQCECASSPSSIAEGLSTLEAQPRAAQGQAWGRSRCGSLLNCPDLGGGGTGGPPALCNAHAEDLGIDHACAGNFGEGNRKMGAKGFSLVFKDCSHSYHRAFFVGGRALATQRPGGIAKVMFCQSKWS